MGEPNPPNTSCPEAPLIGQFWEFTLQSCIDQCTYEFFEGLYPVEYSCLEGSGICHYEPIFVGCYYEDPVLYCLMFFTLTYWTCTESSSSAVNTNDIPRLMQYDYFGLNFDTVLYDLYDVGDHISKVLSLRSRPESINVKIKFNPADFFV